MVEAAGEDRALADAGLGRRPPRRRRRAARRAVGGRGGGRRGRAAPRASRGARGCARRARPAPGRTARRCACGSRSGNARGSRGRRCGRDAPRSRASSAARRSGLSNDLALGLALPEQVDHRPRPGDQRLEWRAAPPARITSSGSCPRRHQREAQRPCRRSSSGSARSISRCAAREPGRVAVERDHRLVGDAPQQLRAASGGDRGAERRDGVRRARPAPARSRPCSPRRRSALPALPAAVARRADVEERAALVEERRLGRVQVLRPARPAAIARPPKAMRAAARVADREDDAVAEAVVGLAAVVRAADQARPRRAGRARRRPWPSGASSSAVRSLAGEADLEALAGRPAPTPRRSR